MTKNLPIPNNNRDRVFLAYFRDNNEPLAVNVLDVAPFLDGHIGHYIYCGQASQLNALQESFFGHYGDEGPLQQVLKTAVSVRPTTGHFFRPGSPNGRQSLGALSISSNFGQFDL